MKDRKKKTNPTVLNKILVLPVGENSPRPQMYDPRAETEGDKMLKVLEDGGYLGNREVVHVALVEAFQRGFDTAKNDKLTDS